MQPAEAHFQEIVVIMWEDHSGPFASAWYVAGEMELTGNVVDETDVYVARAAIESGPIGVQLVHSGAPELLAETERESTIRMVEDRTIVLT